MTMTAFHSALAEDMTSYVELKRALGFKAHCLERNLRVLDGFLVRRHHNAEDLSLPILEAWLGEPPDLKPTTRALRLRIVRQFCLYRRRTQPGAYVPDKQNACKIWPARLPRFTPHIFTVEEMRRLLRAALDLRPYRSNPHRAQTFFNRLLLLYSTGLRISEAHALRFGDIDWTEGTLLIRESKFFKSRIVPVHADTRSSLRDYQALLDLPRRDASRQLPLFQRGQRRAYSLEGLREVGIQILRSSGLKPATGHVGPRLHDLRHTFAVRCIERWYADGRDVQNLLPRLATYMSHGSFAATQYYVTITDTILHRAGERFERACAPGRSA
jgi:integrase